MPSSRTVLLVSLLIAALAVISHAISSLPCPEGCRCYPEAHYVSCRNTSLTAFPSVPLTNFRLLHLADSNLPLLGRGFFFLRGITELTMLEVMQCGVRKVELGAFRGLTELTTLSLMGNELSEIIPGTFGDVSKLVVLELDNNRLQHLESDLFSGLDNLEYIHLGRNRLQYVHPDTFLGLPKLHTLDLSFNPDLQIPTDSNFINSHSLSLLDISHCNVRSVSVETFTNVSALERLDLSYNNLKTVDINILRALLKLSGLYLDDNPLQWDSQLQEVWRWCEDRHIATVYGGEVTECDTPSEVKEWGGVC